MKIFNGVAELQQAVGTHLGYSDWYEVTQERIDFFADATGDHQWIHVDPEAAGPLRYDHCARFSDLVVASGACRSDLAHKRGEDGSQLRLQQGSLPHCRRSWRSSACRRRTDCDHFYFCRHIGGGRAVRFDRGHGHRAGRGWPEACVRGRMDTATGGSTPYVEHFTCEPVRRRFRSRRTGEVNRRRSRDISIHEERIRGAVVGGIGEIVRGGGTALSATRRFRGRVAASSAPPRIRSRPNGRHCIGRTGEHR